PPARTEIRTGPATRAARTNPARHWLCAAGAATARQDGKSPAKAGYDPGHRYTSGPGPAKPPDLHHDHLMPPPPNGQRPASDVAVPSESAHPERPHTRPAPLG